MSHSSPSVKDANLSRSNKGIDRTARLINRNDQSTFPSSFIRDVTNDINEYINSMPEFVFLLFECTPDSLRTALLSQAKINRLLLNRVGAMKVESAHMDQIDFSSPRKLKPSFQNTAPTGSPMSSSGLTHNNSSGFQSNSTFSGTSFNSANVVENLDSILAFPDTKQTMDGRRSGQAPSSYVQPNSVTGSGIVGINPSQGKVFEGYEGGVFKLSDSSSSLPRTPSMNSFSSASSTVPILGHPSTPLVNESVQATIDSDSKLLQEIEELLLSMKVGKEIHIADQRFRTISREYCEFPAFLSLILFQRMVEAKLIAHANIGMLLHIVNLASKGDTSYSDFLPSFDENSRTGSECSTHFYNMNLSPLRVSSMHLEESDNLRPWGSYFTKYVDVYDDGSDEVGFLTNSRHRDEKCIDDEEHAARVLNRQRLQCRTQTMEKRIGILDWCRIWHSSIMDQETKISRFLVLLTPSPPPGLLRELLKVVPHNTFQSLLDIGSHIHSLGFTYPLPSSPILMPQHVPSAHRIRPQDIATSVEALVERHPDLAFLRDSPLEKNQYVTYVLANLMCASHVAPMSARSVRTPYSLLYGSESVTVSDFLKSSAIPSIFLSASTSVSETMHFMPSIYQLLATGFTNAAEATRTSTPVPLQRSVSRALSRRASLHEMGPTLPMSPPSDRARYSDSFSDRDSVAGGNYGLQNPLGALMNVFRRSDSESPSTHLSETHSPDPEELDAPTRGIGPDFAQARAAMMEMLSRRLEELEEAARERDLTLTNTTVSSLNTSVDSEESVPSTEDDLMSDSFGAKNARRDKNSRARLQSPTLSTVSMEFSRKTSLRQVFSDEKGPLQSPASEAAYLKSREQDSFPVANSVQTKPRAKSHGDDENHVSFKLKTRFHSGDDAMSGGADEDEPSTFVDGMSAPSSTRATSPLQRTKMTARRRIASWFGGSPTSNPDSYKLEGTSKQDDVEMESDNVIDGKHEDESDGPCTRRISSTTVVTTASCNSNPSMSVISSSSGTEVTTIPSYGLPRASQASSEPSSRRGSTNSTRSSVSLSVNGKLSPSSHERRMLSLALLLAAPLLEANDPAPHADDKLRTALPQLVHYLRLPISRLMLERVFRIYGRPHRHTEVLHTITSTATEDKKRSGAQNPSYNIITKSLSNSSTGSIGGPASIKAYSMNFAQLARLSAAFFDRCQNGSISMWSRCMDLDDDGVLSMEDLRTSYEGKLWQLKTSGVRVVLTTREVMTQLVHLLPVDTLHMSERRSSVSSLGSMGNRRTSAVQGELTSSLGRSDSCYFSVSDIKKCGVGPFIFDLIISMPSTNEESRIE